MTITHRRLGQNGPEVFPIGIGAMSFSNFYGEATREDALALLEMAMDHGVNHIDTADIYGMGVSEIAIGAFLAKQGKQAQDFFHIATKAGIDRDDTGSGFNNHPDYLKNSLHASLKRLGVDYVDLFYVHRRQQDIPIEEVTETLAGFVKEGLIGAFGFSEIAPTTLRRAAAVHPVAAVQSEYSLQTRGPELGLVQATRDLGTAMVAFSPVGRGLLTDRPHSAKDIANMPFLAVNPRFMGANLTRNIAATAAFRDLAKDMGMAASTLAIAWLLHQDHHIIPIPGTRSVTHFAELIAAAGVKLGDEDKARIDAIMPPGWCHGDRYSDTQWRAIERYC
jgi:aryl-alcohol dehydrogenase-like predicted oxidoreductase